MLIALAAGLLLLISGFAYEELSRRRQAVRFPPVGQLIDVGGHRLHLLSKGAGEPTVVVEQGAGGPSLNWLPLQEQIADFTRVCLYDRAGYQWSDPVSVPRSLADRVKDLHTLLVNGHVPGPYVLVAHSYGGFLIRLFASEYPECVAGLVFVDTPHELSYFRPEVLSAYRKFRWMMNLMNLLSHVGLPRLLRFPPAMARREYFAAASDDIASLERSADWLVKPDAFHPLGDLPIAVITHGVPFPGPFAVLEKGWREGQDRLAKLSTNSLFLVAEKSNHMVQNDEPEVVLRVIRTVVEKAREIGASARLKTPA
jgi:pimeloyl-ACP methyl ester carboxylesterase